MLFKYLTPKRAVFAAPFRTLGQKRATKTGRPNVKNSQTVMTRRQEHPPPCVRTYLQISVNIHSHSVHWI